MTDGLARTAVERGARLVAHEHGSDVYTAAEPASGEFAELERGLYEACAAAVIRDLGGQLLRRVAHLRDDWPTNKSDVALFQLVRDEIRVACDIPVGWRPDPIAESTSGTEPESAP